MQPMKLKRTRRDGPEAKVQQDLECFLKARDWFVISTHGNEFQQGLPDLYCAHFSYGARWIEVKNAAQYSFTGAQLQVFPALTSKGVGVWILTEASEFQYQWLFEPANYHHFMGRSSSPWLKK